VKRSDLVKARRAIRLVSQAAGSISTVRALASLGISGAQAGQWIEAGQRLLEDGWLPDYWRCGAVSCGHLLPMLDPTTRRPWIRIPCCPLCHANDWTEPDREQTVYLKLARSDRRADELLAASAGKRLRAILDSKEEKHAAPQARLIQWLLPILNPSKFGGASTDGAPALDGDVPAWARALKPEDIDRLPGHVLDRLQEISDQHAALEEEARRLIPDSVNGVLVLEG